MQKDIDLYIDRYIGLLAYMIFRQLSVEAESVNSSFLPAMTNEIPHFKYKRISLRSKQVGCIVLGEEIMHRMAPLGSEGSMDEFYKEFGYTLELAKRGILPEEFIWETYFRHPDRNCAHCYQLHMIEYLLKYADAFAKKYGHDCDNWIAVHAEARAACKSGCADKKLF